MSLTKNMEPYISDPKLVHRIKAFLQTKRPGTVNLIEPESVSQHLQATYSEYSRKKKNAFLLSVSKALQVAKTELCGHDSDSKSLKRHRSDSSTSSEAEDLVAYENTNAMNLAMRKLYKNNAGRTPTESLAANQTRIPKKKKSPAPVIHMEKARSTSPSWIIDRNASNGMSEEYEEHGRLTGGHEQDMTAADTSTSNMNGKKNTQIACTCACGRKEMNVNYKTKTPTKTSFVKTSSSTPSRHEERDKIKGSGTIAAADSDTAGSSERKGAAAKRKKLRHKRMKQSEVDSVSSDSELTIPETDLNDFGGSKTLLKELHRELYALLYSDYDRFGGEILNNGYLLHGPTGSGKQFLIECIAGHLKWPLMKPGINTLISGVPGESEQRIRDLFENAAAHAPCVLSLEDIDCLAPRQENPGTSKDMSTRIVSELGRCIDIRMENSPRIGEFWRNPADCPRLRTRPETVLLIASTTKINSIHKNLRIPGRFIEKGLGIPDEQSRESILQKVCANCSISSEVSLKTLAKLTPGFVGGDLHKLKHDAYSMARDRVISLYHTSKDETKEFPEFCAPPAHLIGKEIVLSEQDKEARIVTMDDFMRALEMAQPAAKREGFATVPTTTWADVGALKNVRAQLKKSILRRVADPEGAAGFGLSSKTGIILIGPPGCGKTMVAKAMANEAGLNFMYIQGPELLDKYVGESERKLRDVFYKAQMCAPCLIFFDEMDTLCSNRQSNEGSNVGKSVTNQLLALMDGCGERNQVYVMGATNIIENVDPALQRPGRFDKRIFIGLPEIEDRLDILKILTSKPGNKPKPVDCDFQKVAEDTEGFSSADLKQLLEEASDIAWDDSLQDEAWRTAKGTKEYLLRGDHLNRALQLVKPSVKKKDMEKYRQMGFQT